MTVPASRKRQNENDRYMPPPVIFVNS